LRFLADDVAKELDLVLDAILRATSRRNPVGGTGRIITLSRGGQV
jgi:hypothetical protein